MPALRRLLPAAALAVSFASAIPQSYAETIVISPADDLRAATDALAPGDELVLTAGTYTLSVGLKIDLFSTAANPSIIRAQNGADVLISLPSAAHNIVEVRNSQHVIIRNLRFTGGSHGIRLMDSDFITIEGCEIFETGDVALSANAGGTYDGLVIRRNHIHHTNGTGEGMYLGCNNDGCRISNGLIEGNYIHHTNRSTVEQGDGIEIKEGSFGNVVRDNVIHDTNYPGILTYSTVGNGPPNIVEGNLIWGTASYPIQSAADAIIRNNIILGGPIAMQAHQAGSPSNLIVAHNTIISSDYAVEARSVSGPVQIVNNAVYGNSGPAINLVSGDLSQVEVAGNVGDGGLAGASGGLQQGAGPGADFVDAGYGRTPPLDVFPATGGGLVGAADARHVTALDFNGTPRDGAADAGAYRYDAAGNPGWALSAGFKDAAAPLIRPEPPTNLGAH